VKEAEIITDFSKNLTAFNSDIYQLTVLLLYIAASLSFLLLKSIHDIVINIVIIVLIVLGISSILWYISWEFVVHESPTSHPTISKKEKEFIETSISASGDNSEVC
jgi:protein-S-isoprenylcysteine O-methyltransferase Ste14